MKIRKIIEDNYNELSMSEKIVAKEILNGNIDPVSHSITQAAKKAGVSMSLINKFCSKIGVSGWKTFKALSFMELRTQKLWEDGLFSEEFNLILNSLSKNQKIIDLFINKLYNKMYSSEKVVVFANGTTKKVVDIVAHKWNKMGGNLIVYDYTESFISLNRKTIVLFLTISGHNDKIKYYERQTSSENTFLITFGSVKNFKGKSLKLDIYKHFGKTEKAFPVETDVFFHFLLNKFIKLLIKDSTIIKHKIKEINIKEV